ncbi:hypothetical protein PTTG_26475 [Puccinia triticina 1-1 BBBD Race 1]|uniref:Tet-like 2OG-Fe(II) oxygenase domain-containing protein n=2 Tax=Puccinia triticina TaxID=208348 RepID=A0A180GVE3_PUCT1|nr:uncharacterized protein PtA15_10A265 [Puccinia triticina]OAV95963.1 hypothetical protein PTTG_26475 [Puccinia triticina 1-1 BBBD Race 1]WAQ88845.1 hypothetical protein PtA15_10A265 [Puccinia triticina]
MAVNKTVSAKNFMKSWAQKRRRMNQRHSIVSLNITPNFFKGQQLIWSMQKFDELHLYPKIQAENKKQHRKPTAKELAHAQTIVDSFIHFTHGKIILIDDTKGEVVAVIEFIPISQLTTKERDEFNCITNFLHKLKKFVYPIAPGRGWGGKMWGVGWRKFMKALELFGSYIKLHTAWSFTRDYLQLALQSQIVSWILGRLFRSMGDIPFESNRNLMEKHGVPSFASGEFNDCLTEFDCAPHITFTTNGFYNQPHTDKGNASKFAFALFVPTKTSDGTLANPSTNAGASGSQFVLPDYKFCIAFPQQCVVKLLWAANRCKHCTLPGIEPKGFT